MTLQGIKSTADSGKTVHWRNESYIIEKEDGEYYIVWMAGTRQQNSIGLFSGSEGNEVLNGNESDFYIKES